MNTETYLNHPTFGLLFRICMVEENQELFTTLYAQRLFFVVTSSLGGFSFEPVGRADAKLMVENRMRQQRRQGQTDDHNKLQKVHQQTFL